VVSRYGKPSTLSGKNPTDTRSRCDRNNAGNLYACACSATSGWERILFNWTHKVLHIRAARLVNTREIQQLQSARGGASERVTATCTTTNTRHKSPALKEFEGTDKEKRMVFSVSSYTGIDVHRRTARLTKVRETRQSKSVRGGVRERIAPTCTTTNTRHKSTAQMVTVPSVCLNASYKPQALSGCHLEMAPNQPATWTVSVPSLKTSRRGTVTAMQTVAAMHIVYTCHGGVLLATLLSVFILLLQDLVLEMFVLVFMLLMLSDLVALQVFVAVSKLLLCAYYAHVLTVSLARFATPTTLLVAYVSHYGVLVPSMGHGVYIAASAHTRIAIRYVSMTGVGAGADQQHDVCCGSSEHIVKYV
jgi:hypothetical protein